MLSSFFFNISSSSASSAAVLGSAGLGSLRDSGSSPHHHLGSGGANFSTASTSGGGAGRRSWHRFAVISSSTDEAIEELDRELARPDFLDNVNEVGTSRQWEDTGNDGGEGEQEAKGTGEHDVEIGDKFIGEPPVGRPHSPTYAEYDSRHKFKWPEQPHQARKKNSYPASKVVSVIDEDWLAQMYRQHETPKDIFFWVPESNERADQPPEDCVVVNVDTMEAGL